VSKLKRFIKSLPYLFGGLFSGFLGYALPLTVKESDPAFIQAIGEVSRVMGYVGCGMSLWIVFCILIGKEKWALRDN
jgi:hypothetical protein